MDVNLATYIKKENVLITWKEFTEVFVLECCEESETFSETINFQNINIWTLSIIYLFFFQSKKISPFPIVPVNFIKISNLVKFKIFYI